MTAHLSAVFSQAAAATRTTGPLPCAPEAQGFTVDLQELLRLHGQASTAVVLMLLSMATVIPIAGAGMVLSFAIFVLAWIGQFIGHQLEGKKPRFFEDVQYLLVGPLWTLSKLYKRLGWRW